MVKKTTQARTNVAKTPKLRINLLTITIILIILLIIFVCITLTIIFSARLIKSARPEPVLSGLDIFSKWTPSPASTVTVQGYPGPAEVYLPSSSEMPEGAVNVLRENPQLEDGKSEKGTFAISSYTFKKGTTEGIREVSFGIWVTNNSDIAINAYNKLIKETGAESITQGEFGEDEQHFTINKLDRGFFRSDWLLRKGNVIIIISGYFKKQIDQSTMLDQLLKYKMTILNKLAVK